MQRRHRIQKQGHRSSTATGTGASQHPSPAGDDLDPVGMQQLMGNQRSRRAIRREKERARRRTLEENRRRRNRVEEPTGSRTGGRPTGKDPADSTTGGTTGDQTPSPDSSGTTEAETETSSPALEGSTPASSGASTGQSSGSGPVPSAEELLDPEEIEELPEDLVALMSRNYYERDYVASTGRGEFDALYCPAKGLLTIVLRLGFEFNSGDPDHDAVKQAEADAGKPFDPSSFEWTDEEKQQWKENAISEAESTWSNQHVISTTRPGWEALPPIRVQVHLIECEQDANFTVKAEKYPRDFGGTEEMRDHVNYGDERIGMYESAADGGAGNPQGGTALPDMNRWYRNFRKAPHDIKPLVRCIRRANPKEVRFRKGTDELESGDRQATERFGRVLSDPGIPVFNLDVTGHAEADEQADSSQFSLPAARAERVKSILEDQDARTRPDTMASTRQDQGPVASLKMDSTFSQVTFSHEIGHALGLADEYVEADKGLNLNDPVHHLDPKENPDYDQDTRAITDARIMSTGNVVLPEHYATFVEVLGKMTGIRSDWTVG